LLNARRFSNITHVTEYYELLSCVHKSDECLGSKRGYALKWHDTLTSAYNNRNLVLT